MCDLHRMNSNVEAMCRVFGGVSDGAPNLPVFNEIYRDRDAPVIGQEVFAFAGLCRPAGEGERFVFLSTAPNALAGAIHSKAMPMVLAPNE